MNFKNMNRRDLMRGLGVGASGLFLPSLLCPRVAQAAAPKRLLLVYSSHGPVYQNWSMRRPNLPDMAQDWEFDLSSTAEADFSTTLRPLYRHRQQINVLDGLANISGMGDRKTNNHNTGNEGGSSNSSVDQLVADKFTDRGKMRSLYLDNGPWSPFYTGSTELRGETSAARAFERLFPSTVKSSDPRKDKIRARHSATMKKVRDEFLRVKGQLSGTDQKKVSDHFDLVDSLQSSLEVREQLKCSFAMDPGADPAVETQDAKIKKFNSLVAATFACDLTRVASLSWGQVPADEMATLGFKVGDVHQDLAHEALPGKQFALDGMTAYYTRHATQFADLLDKLKAVKEDNGTLLDNTVVLWVNELANGPHFFNRLMVIMAGGGGGYFKTGRYLKYAETKDYQFKQYAGSGGDLPLGPAHSHVLVSAVQAMGLTNNVVGMPRVTADGAKVVDLSGPLPRLRG
jgi:hypothetical protein